MLPVEPGVPPAPPGWSPPGCDDWPARPEEPAVPPCDARALPVEPLLPPGDLPLLPDEPLLVSGVSPALPASPPGGCGQPCGVDGADESPEACPDPRVDGLPLDPGCPGGELLEPDWPPPDDGCDGNGDSLPPGFAGWLGLWLGLPPEVEGDEGDEDAGGCGKVGDEVELLVVQPAKASTQAAGHA